MPAVVLMPSFGSCPYRTDNEAHVVKHYRRRWKLPVVLGRDTFQDGLFARTRAINNAAREAFLKHPTHDVFVLCDNDLLPDEETFSRALEAVQDHAAVTPHSQTLLLTRSGRMQYLKTGRSRNYSVTETGSRSFVVIRREVFRAVNGMDEKFRGWGPEDKAFIVSVEKQAGPVLALPGKRLHLWHPLDASRFKRDALERNRARFRRYASAAPEEAARLAREYGLWEDGPAPAPELKAPDSDPSPAPRTARRFNHAVGVENVRDAISALSKVGVSAWIQDGTLLGAVREGKIIDWDTDLDLGVMSKSWGPSAQEALVSAGFKNAANFNSPDRDYHQHWTRNGVKFDIFHYYTEEDGRIWHGLRGARSRFYYPQAFTLAPVKLCGTPLPAPFPPEDFLRTKYGEGWRVPRRKWNMATDPANVSRLAR